MLRHRAGRAVRIVLSERLTDEYVIVLRRIQLANVDRLVVQAGTRLIVQGQNDRTSGFVACASMMRS